MFRIPVDFPMITTTSKVMSIEDTKKTQRPYRCGMILLCFGALINWLGLTESYATIVRYVGIGCIICGTLLICSAMCCWVRLSQRSASISENVEEPIHVITVNNSNSNVNTEKPPSYDSVTLEPPSYDDAIKLSPIYLSNNTQEISTIPTCSTSQSQCENEIIQTMQKANR